MATERELWIAEFLTEIDEKVGLGLQDDPRFVNRSAFLKRYRQRIPTWKEGDQGFSDEMSSMVNELFVAKWILSQKACVELIYEQEGSRKEGSTIDFFVRCDNGQQYYIDVKTIQPQTQDDWDKFIKHSELFPSNVEVILSKDGLGGELWHARYNSRAAMLVYSKELEKKLLNYEVNEQTEIIMTFCGNGFDWHEDALEDFADFYHTGRHNPDDCFSNMEKHSMNADGITFDKSINGFMYFERANTETDIKRVVCPVQGPWVGDRWQSESHGPRE